MTVLLVASSEACAGRSLIAAALAYRLARDGAQVTLARLAGDESAVPDAATFASLEDVAAAGRALTPDDVRACSGTVVLEAPAGTVKDLAAALGARVIAVGGPTSPDVDAPKDALIGKIITRVPAAAVTAVRARAGVLAVLPEDRVLAAPSLDDLAAALGGRWLHRSAEPQSIGRVMIGTVSSDAGSPYFGNRERTCVITRFDKTDVQLAALLTDLQCMVITGGGEPSPYLLDRVRSHPDEVSLLSVPSSTVETMVKVEGLYGGSRFDGEAKLRRVVEMLDEVGASLLLPVAS
ncbi:MAG: DRTGG domain-containing protein [Dehalococcoidia bacterium]